MHLSRKQELTSKFVFIILLQVKNEVCTNIFSKNSTNCKREIRTTNLVVANTHTYLGCTI